MNLNRRSQERKVPERLVFCKVEGENGGSVLNLSEAGLCFESLDPIQGKELLRLRLCMELASPVEAIGKLVWIDSTRRIGGLSFLSMSTPAREQIRNWLSESAGAESLSKKAVTWHELREPGEPKGANAPELRSMPTRAPSAPAPPTEAELREPRLPEMTAPSFGDMNLAGVRSDGLQLIPIERHQSENRWQFIRGVLVGIGISALVTVPIFRYAGVEKQTSSVPTTARPAEKAQASEGQGSTAMPEPAAAKTANGTTATEAPQRPQRANEALHTAVKRAAVTTGAAAQVRAEPSFEARPTVWLPTHATTEQAQQARKVAATPQQLWSGVQAGNMKAAVALADLYARGEGVPVNCEQARVLLLVAAEKNNAEAPKKLQELDKGGCPTGGR